jgi:hypothetical protein
VIHQGHRNRRLRIRRPQDPIGNSAGLFRHDSVDRSRLHIHRDHAALDGHGVLQGAGT